MTCSTDYGKFINQQGTPRAYKLGLPSMPISPRILNVTRGFRLKRSQVLRAIEAGSCIWVEVGVSVRDLSIAESIAFRNQQAAVREPLVNAEIPGLVFDGTTRYDLIKQANEFATRA